MTVNNTPIATVVTDAAPATLAEPAAGRDVVSSVSVEQVVQIDPHAVRIEDNVRAEARLSRRFVASVKSHGVLVPVLAYADADGAVVVRDGQRRVLAAREARLSTIPAYVVDRKDETRMRVIEQMIANEHREALSTGERAAAWRQLSLEGMSAAAIARQTGAKRKEVEAGLVVAGHDIAAAAVAEYDLTLDQAAVLVELEGDPDALAELREVAKRNPAMFDHYAQRALDAKATRDEIARLRTDYEAEGYTVVDWPTYGDTDTLFLRELQTPDGERLSEENYVGKAGHAVAIGERWGEVAVDHVVVDWREHGLQRLGSTGTVTGGKLTDEQKAERREVVANNKAWASAEKVRRAWVTDLLGRKRLPADALPFAAVTLATNTFEVSRAANGDHAMAEELLGYEHTYGQQPLATLVANTPTKAAQVVLAVALGALEASIGKHTWRNPTSTARKYLRQLEAWGYALSEVEQLVTADPAERAPAAEVEEPDPASGDESEVNGDDSENAPDA